MAGALIRYPLYWDPILQGFTTAMAVARQILQERDSLNSRGALASLHGGWWQRQQRKALELWRAWAFSHR